MPKTSLDADPALGGLIARLTAASREVATRWPGETGKRQPAHTVYGGAHLFRHDTAAKLGARALEALDKHAPDGATLKAAFDLSISNERADTIRARVAEKLRREAVEDFRIDFEDGYGNRSDDEEDAHAEAAAGEVAKGMKLGTLPPFLGIRVKTFSDDRLRERAVRTADVFLTGLCAQTAGKLPANFVICLPKIKHREQVAVLADLLELLERRLDLATGALKLEIMVEATQTLFDEHGTLQLPQLLDAARGRCVAAHFGTYDYTASHGITASQQRMRHPACTLARELMQIAFAGTGIFLSDGATNVMPVGPHAVRPGGPPLTPAQRDENRAIVHRAWKRHFDDVQESLRLGFYQGWDLHPAQLVSRFSALYAFFLEGLEPAADRLRNFVAKTGQATLVGDVFDDAATGQGLLNVFLRAVSTGAMSEEEALARTGITLEELRSRSFLTILEGRRR